MEEDQKVQRFFCNREDYLRVTGLINVALITWQVLIFFSSLQLSKVQTMIYLGKTDQCEPFQHVNPGLVCNNEGKCMTLYEPAKKMRLTLKA